MIIVIILGFLGIALILCDLHLQLQEIAKTLKWMAQREGKE